MTTSTSELTEHDLDVLFAILKEFSQAGRMEDARAIARAYSTAQAILYPEDVEDLESDPEFVRAMEESERDIKEGRLIPHEEVVRRLRELDDAER